MKDAYPNKQLQTLRQQIALFEGLLREKKEALRVAEAIEKQKDDLWRRHMMGERLSTPENS